jgi:hypothetical protein
MQKLLENHPYIQEILSLERQYENRTEFHQHAEPLLVKMGQDEAFLKLVIQRNFEDQAYLKQTWSLYNIPFFYIYETSDFYLKIHLFPGMQNFVQGTAAHCIHHHNNYILTTTAIYGSGYETFIFEKETGFDQNSLRAKLKLNRHFTQKEKPVHRIDSWEPHLVFNPESFSATLQLWTPDAKRATDALRNNPLLKLLKTPIRKAIHLLGLESRIGIASEKTYQWYPNGDHFMSIEENAYFEPTKKAVGPEINTYSIQTVFYFIQNRGLIDTEYLGKLIVKNSTPSYYLPFVKAVLEGKKIEETFCKESINIPQKAYSQKDVLQTMRS